MHIGLTRKIDCSSHEIGSSGAQVLYHAGMPLEGSSLPYLKGARRRDSQELGSDLMERGPSELDSIKGLYYAP